MLPILKLWSTVCSFCICQLGINSVVQMLQFLWAGLQREAGLLSAGGGIREHEGCVQRRVWRISSARRQGRVHLSRLCGVAQRPVGEGTFIFTFIFILTSLMWKNDLKWLNIWSFLGTSTADFLIYWYWPISVNQHTQLFNYEILGRFIAKPLHFKFFKCFWKKCLVLTAAAFIWLKMQ